MNRLHKGWLGVLLSGIFWYAKAVGTLDISSIKNEQETLRKLLASTPDLKGFNNVKSAHVRKPIFEGSTPMDKTDKPLRCLYDHRSYVAGDMVKTSEGWFRCTPTFFCDEGLPSRLQSGTSAWVKLEG